MLLSLTLLLHVLPPIFTSPSPFVPTDFLSLLQEATTGVGGAAGAASAGGGAAGGIGTGAAGAGLGTVGTGLGTGGTGLGTISNEDTC